MRIEEKTVWKVVESLAKEADGNAREIEAIAWNESEGAKCMTKSFLCHRREESKVKEKARWSWKLKRGAYQGNQRQSQNGDRENWWKCVCSQIDKVV